MKLYKGMIFHNEHMEPDCLVLEINEKENILKVEILSKVPWVEDWNLAHYRIGVLRGDYYIED